MRYVVACRLAELVGGGARSVRGTDVHRQSDNEDNAEGPETVEVRAGGRVAGGRVVRQHQVLQAVRFELAQARDEQREKVRFSFLPAIEAHSSPRLLRNSTPCHTFRSLTNDRFLFQNSTGVFFSKSISRECIRYCIVV